MCGRYALSKLPAHLIEEFEIHTGGTLASLPILPADWNIAPTKKIYIIRHDAEGQRELVTASWGLIAPWSKSEADAVKSQSIAINARTESVDEKPTFRSAFKSRRCLIPADGYYEWATELAAPSKQPFYISRTDQGTLLFAGIWDRWISPSGEIRESASIITREAVSPLAQIHHRMPTFLPKDRWDAWLDSSLIDIAQIRKLMDVASPADGIQAHPVSKAVNLVRNNGPELTIPVELGEPETLF
jgi:putative SOS response-associated peptidase YedK